MKPRPDPEKMAQMVAESVNQIWLAGLSAVSMAEKESSKFFDTLSRLTGNIQAQTARTAGMAKKTVSGGRHAASESWDKLEEIFELRVGRALNALQIPTARDIKELTQRVDKLAKSVEEIGAKGVGGSKKVRKRKTAVRKTASPRKTKSKTGKKPAAKSGTRTKAKSKSKTKSKSKAKTRTAKKTSSTRTRKTRKATPVKKRTRK